MNRRLLPLSTAGLFSLLISFPAFSDTTTQITSGTGHSVINQGSGSVNISTAEPSATKDVASALNKIVRFLDASNPTKVQLSNARLLSWLGEDENVLTLDLENPSNMPGYKVKTVLVAPLNPGETKSRTFSMKPARGFSKQTLDTLSVDAHRTQSLPIATVAELKRFLRFPEGYDLIGAGLSANVPDSLVDEYADQHRRADGGTSTDARTVGFIVQTTYQTAFDGKNAASMSAFLYFAKPIQPSSIMIFRSIPQ